jgi:hypothetical protein
MTAEPITTDTIITAVLNDAEMLNALNDNPAKVMLSPDGSEAELSIGEVVPYIVVGTLKALSDLGVLDYNAGNPEEIQDDEAK